MAPYVTAWEWSGMTCLSRYVLRHNMLFLLMMCAIGLSVYVFIDLFDRLDDFLEAQVRLQHIAQYYLYRIPFILAQIFPAVFLLALITQLGIMLRNRELLALQACAISVGTVARTVLGYALLLCLVHFFFSQVLGVAGYKAADQIWNVEVRNRHLATRSLSDIWFRENMTMVHLHQVTPAASAGQGITVYHIDPNHAGRLTETISAQKFSATPQNWLLYNATRTMPDTFTQIHEPTLHLPLQTDVASFLSVDPKASMESLPLWQLGREIERLHDSGSNIERLQTAWHMKLAYASSVLIMALIALAMVSLCSSLYVMIPAGLVVTFCYYGVFVAFASAGENGLIPPLAAAWTGNVLFAALAAAPLILKTHHV
ncbi:MAG: LptF/LptG family permease [Desulfovibrionales bacterium]|nr:LptF/LptG family permease [Desulfovibrionales bacterium]